MYSVKEAGTALNLSRSSIYVQMNNGNLRSVTIGSRRLIPEAAIIDFIEALDTVAPSNDTTPTATPCEVA